MDRGLSHEDIADTATSQVDDTYQGQVRLCRSCRSRRCGDSVRRTRGCERTSRLGSTSCVQHAQQGRNQRVGTREPRRDASEPVPHPTGRGRARDHLHADDVLVDVVLVDSRAGPAGIGSRAHHLVDRRGQGCCDLDAGKRRYEPSRPARHTADESAAAGYIPDESATGIRGFPRNQNRVEYPGRQPRTWRRSGAPEALSWIRSRG